MIYLDNLPSDFSPSMEVSAVHCIWSGKILLLKRAADKKVEPGKWGVPAGKIHLNETELQAALREMFEETGVKLDAEKLHYLQIVPVRYPNFDFIFHLFRVDLKLPLEKGQLRLTLEHTEYAWVRLDEVKYLDLMQDELECISLIK